MDAPVLVSPTMTRSLDAALHALAREQIIAELETWLRIDGEVIGRRFRVGPQRVSLSITQAVNDRARHPGPCRPSSCEGVGERTMSLFGRDCAAGCRDALGSDEAFIVHRLVPALSVLSGLPEPSLATSMLRTTPGAGIVVPRALCAVVIPATWDDGALSLSDVLFGDEA